MGLKFCHAIATWVGGARGNSTMLVVPSFCLRLILTASPPAPRRVASRAVDRYELCADEVLELVRRAVHEDAVRKLDEPDRELPRVWRGPVADP
jgi:hypothetical protein